VTREAREGRRPLAFGEEKVRYTQAKPIITGRPSFFSSLPSPLLFRPAATCQRAQQIRKEGRRFAVPGVVVVDACSGPLSPPLRLLHSPLWLRAFARGHSRHLRPREISFPSSGWLWLCFARMGISAHRVRDVNAQREGEENYFPISPDPLGEASRRRRMRACGKTKRERRTKERRVMSSKPLLRSFFLCSSVPLAGDLTYEPPFIIRVRFPSPRLAPVWLSLTCASSPDDGLASTEDGRTRGETPPPPRWRGVISAEGGGRRRRRGRTRPAASPGSSPTPSSSCACGRSYAGFPLLPSAYREGRKSATPKNSGGEERSICSHTHGWRRCGRVDLTFDVNVIRVTDLIVCFGWKGWGGVEAFDIPACILMMGRRRRSTCLGCVSQRTVSCITISGHSVESGGGERFIQARFIPKQFGKPVE